MLAQIEALENVDHAEIDDRGDLLRLSLSDDVALSRVVALLNGLGYGSDSASDVEARTVIDWYDIGSVGALSRGEAGVIADRILSTFAQNRKLSPAETERTRNAVVDALDDCFVKTPLASGPSLGGFRRSCVRAVEEGLRPIVGPASARTLAELINADMHQDHRG